MGFYKQLSRYYDEIFPINPTDMSFLVSRTQGLKRLLDLGCGTGNKTVFFTGAGREVTGIDSDRAMISRAEDRNSREGLNYVVMDIMEVDSLFQTSSFDAALCLGNTLVHLDGVEQIDQLLTKAAGLLKPGGKLLLQILNYDRILDSGQTVLPVLDSANVRFRRNYAWKNGRMRFVTELELKKNGQVFKNDIPLYPLRREELLACLAKAGLDRTILYGGFSGEAFTPDSFVTIVESSRLFEGENV